MPGITINNATTVASIKKAIEIYQKLDKGETNPAQQEENRKTIADLQKAQAKIERAYETYKQRYVVGKGGVGKDGKPINKEDALNKMATGSSKTLDQVLSMDNIQREIYKEGGLDVAAFDKDENNYVYSVGNQHTGGALSPLFQGPDGKWSTAKLEHTALAIGVGSIAVKGLFSTGLMGLVGKAFMAIAGFSPIGAAFLAGFAALKAFGLVRKLAAPFITAQKQKQERLAAIAKANAEVEEIQKVENGEALGTEEQIIAEFEKFKRAIEFADTPERIDQLKKMIEENKLFNDSYKGVLLGMADEKLGIEKDSGAEEEEKPSGDTPDTPAADEDEKDKDKPELTAKQKTFQLYRKMLADLESGKRVSDREIEALKNSINSLFDDKNKAAMLNRLQEAQDKAHELAAGAPKGTPETPKETPTETLETPDQFRDAMLKVCDIMGEDDRAKQAKELLDKINNSKLSNEEKRTLTEELISSIPEVQNEMDESTPETPAPKTKEEFEAEITEIAKIIDDKSRTSKAREALISLRNSGLPEAEQNELVEKLQNLGLKDSMKPEKLGIDKDKVAEFMSTLSTLRMQLLDPSLTEEQIQETLKGFRGEPKESGEKSTEDAFRENIAAALEGSLMANGKNRNAALNNANQILEDQGFTSTY